MRRNQLRAVALTGGLVLALVGGVTSTVSASMLTPTVTSVLDLGDLALTVPDTGGAVPLPVDAWGGNPARWWVNPVSTACPSDWADTVVTSTTSPSPACVAALLSHHKSAVWVRRVTPHGLLTSLARVTSATGLGRGSVVRHDVPAGAVVFGFGPVGERIVRHTTLSGIGRFVSTGARWRTVAPHTWKTVGVDGLSAKVPGGWPVANATHHPIVLPGECGGQDFPSRYAAGRVTLGSSGYVLYCPVIFSTEVATNRAHPQEGVWLFPKTPSSSGLVWPLGSGSTVPPKDVVWRTVTSHFHDLDLTVVLPDGDQPSGVLQFEVTSGGRTWLGLVGTGQGATTAAEILSTLSVAPGA